MKAVTRLELPDSVPLTITLTMTVEEARVLRQLLESLNHWPMPAFKQVLSASVKAALDAYEREVRVGGDT